MMSNKKYTPDSIKDLRREHSCRKFKGLAALATPVRKKKGLLELSMSMAESNFHFTPSFPTPKLTSVTFNLGDDATKAKEACEAPTFSGLDGDSDPKKPPRQNSNESGQRRDRAIPIVLSEAAQRRSTMMKRQGSFLGLELTEPTFRRATTLQRSDAGGSSMVMDGAMGMPISLPNKPGTPTFDRSKSQRGTGRAHRRGSLQLPAATSPARRRSSHYLQDSSLGQVNTRRPSKSPRRPSRSPQCPKSATARMQTRSLQQRRGSTESRSRPSLGNVDFSADGDSDDDEVSIDHSTEDQPLQVSSSNHVSDDVSKQQRLRGSRRRSMSSSISMPRRRQSQSFSNQKRGLPARSRSIDHSELSQSFSNQKRGLPARSRSIDHSAYCTPRRPAKDSLRQKLQRSNSDRSILSFDDISIDDTVVYLSDKKTNKPDLVKRMGSRAGRPKIRRSTSALLDGGKGELSSSRSSHEVGRRSQLSKKKLPPRSKTFDSSGDLKTSHELGSSSQFKKKIPPRSKTFDSSSVIGALKTLAGPIKSFAHHTSKENGDKEIFKIVAELKSTLPKRAHSKSSSKPKQDSRNKDGPDGRLSEGSRRNSKSRSPRPQRTDTKSSPSPNPLKAMPPRSNSGGKKKPASSACLSEKPLKAMPPRSNSGGKKKPESSACPSLKPFKTKPSRSSSVGKKKPASSEKQRRSGELTPEQSERPVRKVKGPSGSRSSSRDSHKEETSPKAEARHRSLSRDSHKEETTPKAEATQAPIAPTPVPADLGYSSIQTSKPLNHQNNASVAVQTEASDGWRCTCGFVCSSACKFCGICSTPRFWTCHGCGNDQNLCIFTFCAMCGIHKAGDQTPPQEAKLSTGTAPGSPASVMSSSL